MESLQNLVDQPTRFAEKSAISQELLPDIILPALVSALFFFAFLGHRPLVSWDEAIYADIAREFLQGSSWLVPHWNYHPWLERTPLFEWITAALFAVFGISEFWARAASAFAGVGAVVLTYRMANEMCGRRVAWIAATALITTHSFFYQARFGTTDMLLTLWMVVSLYGVYRISKGDLSGWYWFWIGLALGIMTKSAGPAPAFLTLLVVAFKERWNSARLGRPFWCGSLVFLAIVAPWHLYMWSRFGRTFLDDYILRQLLTRSLKPLEGHTGGPAFYAEHILQGAFPWCLFLIPAIVRAVRTWSFQVAGCFAVVVFVFYTVVTTKLPWYILPIYPALSIVAAQEIDRLLPARWSRQAPLAIPLLGAAILWRDLKAPYVRPEVLLIKDHPIAAAGGPLVLCSDEFILDMPAPLFYAHRPTVQAYVQRKPDSVEGLGRIDPVTNDPKFRNPHPLDNLLSNEPALIVIERRLIPAIEKQYRFQRVASDARYALGTIRR